VESDLTVIDDLGKGKWSEKVEERFYVILDGRYRELRPTVITTNLKLSDLEGYVGNAVFDRLKEMTVFVLNSAKSYRALKIEEA
jgi:DNA replication protein DnaC